jgi:hypothetical protein
MLLLVLSIFFWKFSPSIGYIERSSLIDVRDFTPRDLWQRLVAWQRDFVGSILAYRWVVRRFHGCARDQYRYAMVANGDNSAPGGRHC